MPRRLSQNEKDLIAAFGEELRAARTEKDITYTELAERSGVSRTAIWELEHHGRPMLAKNLAKVGKVLEIESPLNCGVDL